MNGPLPYNEGFKCKDGLVLAFFNEQGHDEATPVIASPSKYAEHMADIASRGIKEVTVYTLTRAAIIELPDKEGNQAA